MLRRAAYPGQATGPRIGVRHDLPCRPSPFRAPHGPRPGPDAGVPIWERPAVDADTLERMALAIARTMGGWNDDTTEPNIDNPQMREAMEKHWLQINETCLREGRRYVQAISDAGLLTRTGAVVPPQS